MAGWNGESNTYLYTDFFANDIGNAMGPLQPWRGLY